MFVSIRGCFLGAVRGDTLTTGDFGDEPSGRGETDGEPPRPRPVATAGWRSPSIPLLAALLIMAPSLFLIWLRLGLPERIEGIEISPAPLVVPVEPDVDDGRVPASLTIEWDQPVEMVSPGFEGIVTAVYMEPGDVVSDGGLLMQVDGVDRLAARTPSPFHRNLRLRDAGADVAALQAFLSRGGWFDGEIDGVYGSSTARAVRDLEAELGVVKPTGIFDRRFVVWLPSDSIVIGTLEPIAGRPASGVGSALALGRVSAQTAVVTVAVGAPTEGTLVFLSDDLRLPLSDGGLQVSASARDVITANVSPETTVLEGFVALAEPASAWRVPTASVVVGGSGALCVWLADRDDQYPYEASSVVVSSSTPTGVTLLTAGVRAGDHVLANPFEVLEDPSCP